MSLVVRAALRAGTLHGATTHTVPSRALTSLSSLRALGPGRRRVCSRGWVSYHRPASRASSSLLPPLAAHSIPSDLPFPRARSHRICRPPLGSRSVGTSLHSPPIYDSTTRRRTSTGLRMDTSSVGGACASDLPRKWTEAW